MQTQITIRIQKGGKMSKEGKIEENTEVNLIQ